MAPSVRLTFTGGGESIVVVGGNRPNRETTHPQPLPWFGWIYGVLDHWSPHRLELHVPVLSAPGTTTPYRGASPRVPVALTTFVGRQRELAEARRFLIRHRLVTLSGPGGIGNSRLAGELCLTPPPQLAPDGVWLVELQGVGAEDDLAESVQAALGLTGGQQAALGLTGGQQAALLVLTTFLAGRRLLLALDNCEHLLPAVRSLVVRLLQAVPGLTVLVTSREPLAVLGEQVLPLGPLAVPSDEPGEPQPDVVAARRYDAVALLLDRATAVDPRFRLDHGNVGAAVALCRRLDGVPLAIELAAARLRTLSLAELVGRLDDRFALLTRGDPTGLDRHQTLRATVAWSYDLCTVAEQRLWAELSVLHGGADLTAVLAVCAAEPGVDLLDALVAKSVLQVHTEHGGTRYRMLDTLAGYGRERLAEAGRTAELTERHARHFAGVAADFEAGFFSPAQLEWIARVRADRRNLTAALATLVQGHLDGGRAAVTMAVALRMHWVSRAACEGRRWLEHSLARYPDRSADRALALATWATLGSLFVTEAEQRLAEAEAIAADLGSDRLDARIAEARASISIMHGDPGATRAAGARAVELADRVGDQTVRLIGYSWAAVAAVMQGDPDGRDLCLEMVAACEAVGDRWLQASAYHHLAIEARMRDDLDAAERAADRSVELAYDSANLVALALVLVQVSAIAAARGQFQRTAQLLGGAYELAEEIGAGSAPVGRLGEAVTDLHDAALAALGDQRYLRARHQGANWPLARLVAAARAGAGAPEPGSLTSREWEVARLIAQGKTNRGIAADLHLSPRTVEGHVERILAKLGVHGRTEVALWAAEQLSDRRPDGR